MERGLHERDRVGVQDFVLLEDFQSEHAFIDNLRKRFNENLIYVSKGCSLSSGCLNRLPGSRDLSGHAVPFASGINEQNTLASERKDGITFY